MITDWPSAGFVLSDLARDPRVQGQSAKSFTAHFGRIFLVRFTGRLQQRLPSMATPALGMIPGVESETTGDTMVLVHPVMRRPGSEHPFVSIGRVDKNDVLLADESVSKFHAYVKEGNGHFWLQDARSRNGTMLDGAAVPGRGLGDPLALKTGQSVRFGGVDATVLDASALYDLIARLSR